MKKARNAAEMYAFLSALALKAVFINYRSHAVGVFVWMTLITSVAWRVVGQPVLFRTTVPQYVKQSQEKDMYAKHVARVLVVS